MGNANSAMVIKAAMKFQRFLKPKIPEDAPPVMTRSSNSDGVLKYDFFIYFVY